MERAEGFGPNDHVCLVYRDDAELFDMTRRFLSDGLAQGLQVRCLGGPHLDELKDDLGTLDARPGAVGVGDLDMGYSPGATGGPADQVHAYASATEAALADGFAGLRVVAEATPLVLAPEERSAFARYEHLVDRYMTSHPFSAMCAYDGTRLAPEAVAEIACMHPSTSRDATPFRLHAHLSAGAALAGEVDLFSRELLADALDRADLPVIAGEIVIDATALDFIDHRGMQVLADLARRSGATVVLRTARRAPRKLLEIMDIDGVRVESPA
jgi:anti-anti-sigma regulatory factor